MSWIVYIILYLIIYVIYNQTYKIATKKMINPSTLTACIELIGSIVAIIFLPFFKIKFPSDYKMYIFLIMAIIFYTLYDRLNTTIRKGLEASTINIINQLSVVFMTISGFIFFKEKFIIKKFIGALLILASNILIFFHRKETRINKYVIIGIIANICFTIALFLDVNISEQFNLAIYVFLSLAIPGIIIIIFERIKLKDLKKELSNRNNKKAIVVTATSTALVSILQLRAYQLGSVSIIAPLCSLTVILNVIAGCIFHKEKDNISKKIIAAFLILVGIILLNN